MPFAKASMKGPSWNLKEPHDFLSLTNLLQEESSKSVKKQTSTRIAKKHSDNNLTLFPNDDVENTEQIPPIDLEDQEIR